MYESRILRHRHVLNWLMQPVVHKGDDEKRRLVSESERLEFHSHEREGGMAIEKRENEALCPHPSCEAEYSVAKDVSQPENFVTLQSISKPSVPAQSVTKRPKRRNKQTV